MARVMTCLSCGGPVEWKGPLSNLTHTECLECGAVNNEAQHEFGPCSTCQQPYHCEFQGSCEQGYSEKDSD